MFCENKREVGDAKELTGVQRSWVPQRDKAISYTMGRTGESFKNVAEVKNDVQTSLNMNEGVHHIHPKQVPDTYFKHVRSITVRENNTLCPRP